MERKKGKGCYGIIVFMVILSFLCQLVLMEKPLFSQDKNKFKKFVNQTQKSMSQFNKNLQKGVRNWSKNTSRTINSYTNKARQSYNQSMNRARQSVNHYKNKARQYYNDSMNRAKQKVNRYTNNYYRPQSNRRTSNQLRINWNKLSITAQRQISNIMNHSPSTVNKCARAFKEWGDAAGTKLTRIYRNYNRSVGDRLYRELSRFKSQARSSILDCYENFGTNIGDSVRNIYNKYGTTAGYKVYSAFTSYGKSIGNQLCDVYYRVSPAVGTQIRDYYLPGIVRTVSDNRNQEMAIKTVGCLLNLYQNRKEAVYHGIRIIADTPIATKNGNVTLSGTSKYFVRTYFPYLKGTDIEKDPAKVVTYCIICPDKKAIFSDLRLIPNPNGSAQTLYEKLDEVGGKDVESAIEILDLMADIEAAGEGDIDTEMILENTERVQKLVKYFDDKNQAQIKDMGI